MSMTVADRKKLEDTYAAVIGIRRDLWYHWGLIVAVVLVIGWAFKDGRLEPHHRECNDPPTSVAVREMPDRMP